MHENFNVCIQSYGIKQLFQIVGKIQSIYFENKIEFFALWCLQLVLFCPCVDTTGKAELDALRDDTTQLQVWRMVKIPVLFLSAVFSPDLMYLHRNQHVPPMIAQIRFHLICIATARSGTLHGCLCICNAVWMLIVEVITKHCCSQKLLCAENAEIAWKFPHHLEHNDVVFVISIKM